MAEQASPSFEHNPGVLSPEDERAAAELLGQLRSELQSGSIAFGGARPKITGAIESALAATLAQDDASHETWQALDPQEQQQVLHYTVLGLLQHAAKDVPKGRVRRYESFNISECYNVLLHIAPEIHQLQQEGLGDPGRVVLYHDPKYYQDYFTAYKDRASLNTLQRIATDKPLNPYTATEVVLEYERRRQEARAALGAAAAKPLDDQEVEPTTVQALRRIEMCYQAHMSPYLTRDKVRSFFVGKDKDPEEAIERYMHRIQRMLNYLGDDNDIEPSVLMRFAAAPVIDPVDRVKVYRASIKRLRDAYGDNLHFTNGTITHLASRHVGVEAVMQQAEQYLKNIAALNEEYQRNGLPDATHDKAFLERLALNKDFPTPEEIKTRWYRESLRRSFKKRRHIKPWMINQCLAVYPDESLQKLHFLLINLAGLLDDGLIETHALDPNNPHQGRAFGFSPKLNKLRPIELAAIAHTYGLSKLLCGKNLSREVMYTYGESFAQFTQAALIPKAREQITMLHGPLPHPAEIAAEAHRTLALDHFERRQRSTTSLKEQQVLHDELAVEPSNDELIELSDNPAEALFTLRQALRHNVISLAGGQGQDSDAQEFTLWLQRMPTLRSNHALGRKNIEEAHRMLGKIFSRWHSLAQPRVFDAQKWYGIACCYMSDLQNIQRSLHPYELHQIARMWSGNSVKHIQRLIGQDLTLGEMRSIISAHSRDPIPPLIQAIDSKARGLAALPNSQWREDKQPR